MIRNVILIANLPFVEYLYEVTLTRENLTENHSRKLIYEAELATTFNAQSVVQVILIFYLYLI